MKNWTPRNLRYVNLLPTSIPSGYQSSAALPDTASSIARNAVWPTNITVQIDVIPVDVRSKKPVDTS